MREVEVIRANRKISERTAGKIDDILRVAPMQGSVRIQKNS